MALNTKCPICGSTKVQLSNVENKHGCLYTVLFGMYYICWLLIKWTIGFCMLIFYDWWMAIIKKITGLGYQWKSKRFFSNRSKTYYCHDCGHNFKA